MSMLYGEGMSANARLQGEILEYSNNLTFFAYKIRQFRPAIPNSHIPQYYAARSYRIRKSRQIQAYLGLHV
ncbi:hypothetical protein BKA67DRAFT_558777 [Truncatella angustata]|uniref:Uncharacterized protein n=1 Tax=Truncatella angustata TaxID=152316 RepID=A0A9P9A0R4_9PEZI|nr:uncharacterized protein BKA67DRAFT_558777 [Truncatella angustata]KAH6658697.1 hypothetical protein BKA67DRAFT_558777 [Truncatella angustata]